MMFKRNDGYALSYVLVVLMVLAIIATAVMAPPLRNLQMQQASIERMQEKYIAQGMVEQVVAQLENADSLLSEEAICNLLNGSIIPDGDSIYKITTSSHDCSITARIKITEKTTAEEAEGEAEFDGYTVTYESYEVSYNTEVGS